jgi:hypothetical protein
VILKLLNWQGAAGIAVGLTLLVMLTVQKLDAIHWKKQSDKFEQLYQQEQAAFATTVANARAAADQARAADKANAERVAAESRTINERTANEFQSRLAAARAELERLRVDDEQAAADPRLRRSPSMPRFSVAAGDAAEAAGEDRLPPSDALTATEQAIQLDELIQWVRQQHKVDPNASH